MRASSWERLNALRKGFCPDFITPFGLGNAFGFQFGSRPSTMAKAGCSEVSPGASGEASAHFEPGGTGPRGASGAAICD